MDRDGTGQRGKMRMHAPQSSKRETFVWLLWTLGYLAREAELSGLHDAAGRLRAARAQLVETDREPTTPMA